MEFLLLQVVKAVAWQPFSNNAHQAEKAETGAEELDEEVPSKWANLVGSKSQLSPLDAKLSNQSTESSLQQEHDTRLSFDSLLKQKD